LIRDRLSALGLANTGMWLILSGGRFGSGLI
jgi:hypothetical protein